MSEADPIRLCLEGRIAPEVAMARLLLAGENPDAIKRRVLAARTSASAWAALAQLVETRGRAFERLRRMINAAGIDHAAATTPERIAALFDRAVAASPEASVAFYSLGDARTLAAATDELVRWLSDEHLFAPGMDVLDLGCGIGRVASVLAASARSVLGLDVSPGMITEAQLRCGQQANLRFAVCAGTDLATVPDRSIDLLLAVDSFPYLIQAGLDLAERHVAEAGRVLREGGTMVILNFSYRGDEAADRTCASGWAQRHGFALTRSGISPFTLWDGIAYVFAKH
jgi:ubiquinone/menaquinone biosynthesis C-methylase UbiE